VRRGRRERDWEWESLGESWLVLRARQSPSHTRFCPWSAWRQQTAALTLAGSWNVAFAKSTVASADCRLRQWRKWSNSVCNKPYRLVSYTWLCSRQKNHRNFSAPAVRKRSALSLFTYFSCAHIKLLSWFFTNLMWVLQNFIPTYAACIYLHILGAAWNAC
jgi:hypothetical protein